MDEELTAGKTKLVGLLEVDRSYGWSPGMDFWRIIPNIGSKDLSWLYPN